MLAVMVAMGSSLGRVARLPGPVYRTKRCHGTHRRRPCAEAVRAGLTRTLRSRSDYAAAMSAQDLAGKVAIVTGGASGIGRATAEMLVAEGASVVIGDVDVDHGMELADRIGDAAAFQHADVSDADQVQALVDFAVERFGGLDIMFNNAGIGSPLKRFLPDDLEDFTRIMNVNLFGVIVGAQRAARYMKEHGGGCI